MKKLHSFFAVLLLGILPSALHSQTVTVSEPISVRNESTYQLLGKMGNHFLLFIDKSTEFEVTAYRENMSKAWEKEIVLDKRRPEIKSILPSFGGFDLFYIFRDRGDLLLKWHQYNPGANLIDSMTIRNFGNPINTTYSPIVALESENKEYIAFYQIDQQRTIKAFTFHIPTRKIVWETAFGFSEPINGKSFRQILLTDQGDLYFFYERFNRKNQIEQHYFECYQFGPTNGLELINFKIPMQSHLTFDVLFSYDNLNDILIAGGMYGNESLALANGYFFSSVDPKLPGFPRTQFIPFEEQFIFKFARDKKAQKRLGIELTTIREIVHRRDGGILLIGEQNKKYERNISGGRPSLAGYGGRFITDYYFDDLFMISIHPDGKTHWESILYKRQYSQDDDAVFSSYLLLKTPTALRMLYNDEIKYENAVFEYVISGAGDVDRNAVLNTESQQLQLRIKDGIQVGANEVLIPSERKNRLKLVRVEF